MIKSMKRFFVLSLLLAMAPLTGQAGDCGQDPVYAQDFVGKVKSGVRVRDVACMEGSEILTTLAGGTSVNVIGRTDGWYRVRLESGITGWVGQNYVEQSGEDRSSGEELDRALAMTPTPAIDMVFALKQKGKIFLRVQGAGEAYYVNFDGYRHYLKDGKAAFEIMRALGLGISESDFAKLEKGDTAMKERLRGRIVLRVGKRGEAYYISARDARVIYLKDGLAAYGLLRQEGWGINDRDLWKIGEK